MNEPRDGQRDAQTTTTTTVACLLARSFAHSLAGSEGNEGGWCSLSLSGAQINTMICTTPPATARRMVDGMTGCLVRLVSRPAGRPTGLPGNRLLFPTSRDRLLSQHIRNASNHQLAHRAKLLPRCRTVARSANEWDARLAFRSLGSCLLARVCAAPRSLDLRPRSQDHNWPAASWNTNKNKPTAAPQYFLSLTLM